MIVRMIEVATSLCDALRGVMLELDAAGIFNDSTWNCITAPDDDAVPPPPLKGDRAHCLGRFPLFNRNLGMQGLAPLLGNKKK